MTSPVDGGLGDSLPNSLYRTIPSHFSEELAERINVQQMFILIDGVLPFEACLYYQVLPLFLDGSRLTLGMVTPDDAIAISYVRRIISYHNYLLVPQPISSEALQITLSAYLNYTDTKKTSPPKPANIPRQVRSQKTPDPNFQPTLVVDSPDALEDVGEQTAHAKPVSTQINTNPYPPPPVTPLPDVNLEPDPEVPYTTLEEPTEPVVTEPLSKASKSSPTHPPKLDLETAPALITPLASLSLDLKYAALPVQKLVTLPPRDVLHELLGRVLKGGIGRLYFECQPRHGRVLWSQNGVLQSVLERVELGLFQGLILEMKRLAKISLLPVKQPRQVEIERLYEQNRVLLRFRFMPTQNGEEATLQVLRGAALKFYQQQQLSNLEHDALRMARQLQNKLSEIRDRARKESGLADARLEALPALAHLLRRMEAQLEELQDDEEIEE
jgi:hypothetical protein